MLIAYVPLLIALIGLIMWLASPSTRIGEIGKLMFIIGLFWTVYSTVGKTTKIFG